MRNKIFEFLTKYNYTIITAFVLLLLFNYKYGINIVTIIQDGTNSSSLYSNKIPPDMIPSISLTNQGYDKMKNAQYESKDFSEVIAHLNKGGKIRLNTWHKDDYLYKGDIIVTDEKGGQHNLETVLAKRNGVLVPKLYSFLTTDMFGTEWILKD